MRWRDVKIHRFYELSPSLTGSGCRWKILTWPAPHPAGSLSKSGFAAVVEPGAGERGRPRTGPLLVYCSSYASCSYYSSYASWKPGPLPSGSLDLLQVSPAIPWQFGKQATSHVVHPLLVCWCVLWFSVCLFLTYTWPETNRSIERSNLNSQFSKFKLVPTWTAWQSQSKISPLAGLIFLMRHLFLLLSAL